MMAFLQGSLSPWALTLSIWQVASYSTIKIELLMEAKQTGAGTSMSGLGWADLGLVTQHDMIGQAEMLANLTSHIPLIADADTGYGGPISIVKTVSRYARAGVVALHIEDQVQEKGCGHLLGKEIVSREIFYNRIQAAVNARQELGLDILIIALIDYRQSLGFDEALARLRHAAGIGADIIFPEALVSKSESAENGTIDGQDALFI